MKILHIDETFHPSFGYQINSLAKYQALAGHEVVVFTTDTKHLHVSFRFAADNDRIEELDREYEKNTGVKIVRVPTSGYISNRCVFRSDLFRMIDEVSPDVVMIHQIETYASIRYMMKGYYKKYPTVADSHMLPMASNNKLSKEYNRWFRRFITPKYVKNGITVIRTQDDDYVNSVLGLPESQTPFISFGSDLTLFRPDAAARRKFREENSIPQDAFVITYTGKMDKYKGGILLANALKEKFTAKNGREVVCVVVGNVYGDEYGDEVNAILASSENRIIRFPTQRYVDLPVFYQSSDLCVFAKQCSLSFYDEQACGVPVVFEDNNVNKDRASRGGAAVFRAGDVDSFRLEIQRFIDMPSGEYGRYRDNAISFVTSGYDYKDIAGRITEIMLRAVRDFRNGK